MLLFALYALAHFLLDLFLIRSRPGVAREAEWLALRHEVRVLRRQAGQVRWQAGDRLILRRT